VLLISSQPWGQRKQDRSLLQRELRLQFNGATAISVPGLLSAAGNSGFVQEGAPVPVRRFSLTDVLLVPNKITTSTAFTRESFEHSTPSCANGLFRWRIVGANPPALALRCAPLDGFPALRHLRAAKR